MRDETGRIIVNGLTKSFGPIRAVDSLSFSVEPGSVTGFLGPNGAGKTTSLRMLLGLVRPTAGTATISGHRYRELSHPARVVGAVLEASSFHPGRTGRGHLRVYCAASGVPKRRADEVLAAVGLSEAAHRKVKGYSLGMRQRLALAAALIGDPAVLILDEPSNGLDPEGIAWLRRFLRDLAKQGRTVLVSSHLLAEMQQTVDRVVIITRGRLVRQGSLDDITAGHGETVVVRSPQLDTLGPALERAGGQFTQSGTDELRVSGLDSAAVGHHAFAAGCEVHELRTERLDLEQIFFQLTSGTGLGAPPRGIVPQVQPGYGPGQPQPAQYPPGQYQPVPAQAPPGYAPPGYGPPQPPPPGYPPQQAPGYPPAAPVPGPVTPPPAAQPAQPAQQAQQAQQAGYPPTPPTPAAAQSATAADPTTQPPAANAADAGTLFEPHQRGDDR